MKLYAYSAEYGTVYPTGPETYWVGHGGKRYAAFITAVYGNFVVLPLSDVYLNVSDMTDLPRCDYCGNYGHSWKTHSEARFDVERHNSIYE